MCHITPNTLTKAQNEPWISHGAEKGNYWKLLNWTIDEINWKDNFASIVYFSI